ncbi:MAG: hypothetical protein JO051_01225 [Acidobacteriaceae bacterium]|nr:hypothetical protein [Acidobacteriaceae bacterium]
MLLPVSSTAVLSLLILSFLCLGCWINMFKAAGGRWRFELFSIDFSIGAMIVVLISALTLGTMGSDLAYSDRILVAGRTAQALAVIGGAVFNLGNMLLLASVSLLGVSTAFPLTIGVALIVNSLFHFHSGNLLYLLLGILIMLAAIVFNIRSARLREAAVAASARKEAVPAAAAPHAATVTAGAKPATAGMRTPRQHSGKHAKPHKVRKVRKSLRGIIAAIIGGAALGVFAPILNNCIPGDLGLGPYGGMLLFGVGVLASTIVYDFYFLNITIEGSSLTFGAYLTGKLAQHLLGFAAGALCVGGLLAAALAMSAPATADVSLFLQILLPLLSVVAVSLKKKSIWKELSTSAAIRVPMLVGVCLFACSLAVLAFGISR